MHNTDEGFLFLFPPPPYFNSPDCAWGSAGCFLGGTFFSAPASWRANTALVGPWLQCGFSAHTRVCESFRVGHEPLGSEELQDSHVDPILGYFFWCVRHFGAPTLDVRDVRVSRSFPEVKSGAGRCAKDIAA